MFSQGSWVQSLRKLPKLYKCLYIIYNNLNLKLVWKRKKKLLILVKKDISYKINLMDKWIRVIYSTRVSVCRNILTRAVLKLCVSDGRLNLSDFLS